MSWYVIQTYTGNEEKLVGMIRRIVPRQYYDECFVIYSEQLRHRQQKNQVHVLRLFPGYIFISTYSVDKLFQYLKKVPAMSKIMTAGEFAFTPLYDGEVEFLLNIMDADHIVRLSYVVTDGRNHVSYMSGPLEQCREQIQTYRFNKRYVVVQLLLEGQKKEAKLGIILNDDVRREIAYGKVEATVELPEKYTVTFIDKKTEMPSKKKYRTNLKAGDKVVIMEGVFEGSVAVVSQVKKNTLKIAVRIFSRELQAEVPMDSIKEIGLG